MDGKKSRILTNSRSFPKVKIKLDINMKEYREDIEIKEF